jgi:carbonic anhydrase
MAVTNRTKSRMDHARPLPAFLIARHRDWRASLDADHRARLEALAETGQSPQAMIVACCDSRVMAADVFGAEAGEFFVHRNIANLGPPCSPVGHQRGTSATVEFAVTVLKVRHLIVMGHRGCGGVAGCYDMHGGEGGTALRPDSFVGRWLEILAPPVAPLLARGLERDAALRVLEHEAILLSLENLTTFPFVAEALDAGRLELHGIWKDIGDGDLEYFDSGQNAFVRV